MAKISYRENANELENLYRKSITPTDRFVFSSVKVRKNIYTKKKIKNLTQKSLLPEISQKWLHMPVGIQNDWYQFYKDFFKNGYSAFVKAYYQRRVYGITSDPEYNQFYLGKVGNCKIEAPSNRLHIKQDHPNYYYVMRKVPKTKSQFNPVRISEFATFPIYFQISFKSDLVPLSSNYHARIYVRVYTDYQGRRLEKDFIINLPVRSAHDSLYGNGEYGVSNYGASSVSEWIKTNMIIDKPLGDFRGYEYHIDLYDVRGDLFLDNLIIRHNGINWARDPHFDNMKTTFTRKYYQVASHYDIIDLPNGSSFNSIYFES